MSKLSRQQGKPTDQAPKRRRMRCNRGKHRKRLPSSPQPGARPVLVRETSLDFPPCVLSETASAALLTYLARLSWKSRAIETTAAEITRLMETANVDRRPESRAHVLAHLMVVKLGDLRFDVPATDVYSDPDRAIRLIWNRSDRSVELVFPSSEAELPYLYRSDEQEYQVEENPTPESVLKWLNWVLADRSPVDVRAA